ncbi:cation transporter [Bifidobacterium vespertilionis]|uniref:Cation transporter n=1 Tax=Bifidobacterium vespertilionis TaxID=2562524 RepID=A0A5J5DZB8_9BIFI|nr:cation transporter [Bifidobacterium vespertilionis]KAA8819055.1 cation transporter [Bifidobacterium vespertilionis]KAA8822173.1 cation transporter [Bifidobacterium vespertilionis]
MPQKQIERKALIVGIAVNIFTVVMGMAVFFMTGLKALFLDATFTVISVISGLVAVFLSSHTVRTTDRFPNGKFALEPIYAICKALLTLSLLVFSTFDVIRVAYDYFVFGEGERIETGPVVIYEVMTVAVCFALFVYYRRQNRKLRGASTMLSAEQNSTLVDGAMSFGIGAVAIFLWLLPVGTPLDFLHYTGDFFITLAIVLLTVKEPFGVLKDAFVELVGGVHDDEETNGFVETAALAHLPANTEYEKSLVFKTGMNYTVDVYLAGTGETIDVADLVECKRSLEQELTKRLHIVDVDFVFD